MRLAILAVGRLKAGPERELLERYRQRIADAGRPVGLGPLDCMDVEESRAKRTDDRRAEEGRLLANRCPREALRIALDERGRDLTSENFADLLATTRDSARAAVFFIGGADGLDPAFLATAPVRLRFGAMTLPHGLVRVLLAEQVYRAVTILTGHPYHRGASPRD